MCDGGVDEAEYMSQHRETSCRPGAFDTPGNELGKTRGVELTQTAHTAWIALVGKPLADSFACGVGQSTRLRGFTAC